METGDIGRARHVACSGEARAEALFAQTVVGLCEATLDGQVIRVNREFCRMTGRSAEALLSLHLNDLVVDRDADAWLSCVQLVLSDRAPCSLEHEYVQPNGSSVLAQTCISCMQGDDRPCAILVASIDVADRMQVLPRVDGTRFGVPSYEQSTMLLESISDVVSAVDSGWRHLYVNAAAEKFFKKDRLQLLGKCIWDLFPELRAHPNSRAMERAMIERRSYAWESLSALTGLWTQWRCYPLPGGGLLTLIQNIDDRVRAERALRASERLFQALADLVPPFIWTMDNQGNPQWCNQRWLTYTGTTTLRDRFADVLNRLHPSDRPSTRARMKEALTAGKPFQLEHRIRGGDGVYRWFVAQFQPIVDAHGEVAQWIGVATEIQAQREALAAERTARADAEQSLGHVQRLFDKLPVMLAVFRGPDHTIEVVTELANRFFARPLVGLGVRAAFPDFERSSVFDLLDEVYHSGVSRERAGVRILASSPTAGAAGERLFDVKCHALKDASGSVYGVIAFGLDITDRVRADAEAERQRQELTRLLAQAPFGVSYLQGPEHVVLRVNDAQRKFIGARDVLGLPLPTSYPEAGMRGVHEIVDRVFRTGETVVTRGQPIAWDRSGHGDMVERFFDVTYQAIRTDAGVIDGVLTFTVDVTDAIRAREALAAARDQAERARHAAEDAREYMRGIVAAIPTPVAVTRGDDLTFELVNPAYASLASGRPMVGRALREVFPEIEPDILDMLQEVQRSGREAHVPELRVRYDRAGDGSLYEGTFNTRVAPLRAADGTIGGVVTSVLDVSELVQQRERIQTLRREAELARAELERAHALLETRIAERTSELERSSAALAVEIESNARAETTRRDLLRRLVSAREDEQRRTARDLHDHVDPTLNALLHSIKVACDDAELPPDAGGALADALRLAEDLGRDIHELARGLRTGLLHDLGLHAALHALLRAWSRRYGVKVHFEADWLQRVRLPADVETTLYRVIQEALTNVARHAEAQHVSVLIERQDGHAIASVADDGVGFDPKTPERRPGLAGMHDRVSLAAGSLEIESVLGQGTTIIARVPIAPDPIGEGMRSARLEQRS